MNNHREASKSSVIPAILLALPFTTLFLAFVMGFEPRIEPLARLFDVNESRFGSMVVFAAFGLLLAAFVVSLGPVLRNLRAGMGWRADPINLMLTIACLSLIILVVGAIIVDQYPCWIGVPICD